MPSMSSGCGTIGRTGDSEAVWAPGPNRQQETREHCVGNRLRSPHAHAGQILLNARSISRSE
jgi:hypothetical protein